VALTRQRESARIAEAFRDDLLAVFDRYPVGHRSRLRTTRRASSPAAMPSGPFLTRRQLFEAIERPALRAWPAEPYVFAEWRVRRAGLDYHVKIERHYYSVPYRFARDEVETPSESVKRIAIVGARFKAARNETLQIDAQYTRMY